MTCDARLEVQLARSSTMHSVRCTQDYGHSEPFHEGPSGTRWMALPPKRPASAPAP